jgi:phosphoglycerate dehydrogenase-like enzyme
MMSEYVLAYILAIERQLFETKENQIAKVWGKVSYRGLRELTLGICGLGSIGRHLAQTAHHFGMRVIAFKRTPAEIPYVERVYTGASFGKFLGLLDYLVLVLPNTPDTTGLINSESLKKMKPSAILMNVGRCNAIVEADLIHALKNRQIRAAVLDVFAEEPLPSSSPFWELPNAFITPHNSAISSPEGILPIFCKNYHCFLEKMPLNYMIDFNRGY